MAKQWEGELNGRAAGRAWGTVASELGRTMQAVKQIREREREREPARAPSHTLATISWPTVQMSPNRYAPSSQLELGVVGAHDSLDFASHLSPFDLYQA